MNRGKFRLLLAISLVCLFSSMLLHHYGRQHEDLEDFLKGMGYAVLAGSMMLMPRKPKLQ